MPTSRLTITRQDFQDALARYPALEAITRERIADHVEDDGHESYDELDALRDLEDLGYLTRQQRLAWKLLQIDVGVYRPVTQAELDRTVVLGRRKATPDLRLAGKLYVFNRWPEIL